MSTRVQLINWLIEALGYKTYLEIGVRGGYTFNSVKLSNPLNKVGVDPAPACCSGQILQMTSDEFFARHTAKYDIIFVDGDHGYEQAKRDFSSALWALTPRGCLVAHDVNPLKECWTREPPTGNTTENPKNVWMGGAWRAWAELRTLHEGKGYTVDCRDDLEDPFDCGVLLPWMLERAVFCNPVGVDYDWLEQHRGPALGGPVVFQWFKQVVLANASKETVA